MAKSLHEFFFKVRSCAKHVSCLIERLRRAARATLPGSQKAEFEVGGVVIRDFTGPFADLQHQVMSNISQSQHLNLDNYVLTYIKPLSGHVWKGEMW